MEYGFVTVVLNRDTVVGTQTRYGLDGPAIEFRIPVRGEIFRTSPDQPSGLPASCRMGTGSLILEIKPLGCGADHVPPSSTEVEERVQPYLYSPSGPSWPVLELNLPFSPNLLGLLQNI